MEVSNMFLNRAISRRSFVVGGALLGSLAALSPVLPAQGTEAQPVTQEISLGETIATDIYEFALNNYSWGSELYPPDTSGAYTYQAEQEGKVYYAITGTFKNLSSFSVDVERLTNASFTFNDKYSYDAEIVTVAPDSNDLFSRSVDPLETCLLYIYASVPTEVRDSFEGVELTWNIAAVLGTTSDTSFTREERETYSVIYTLSYTQAEIDAAAEAALGVPVTALEQGGVRVELPSDAYVVLQLDGFVSRALSANLASSVNVTAVSASDLPSSDADMATYFSNRVTEYASANGGSVGEARTLDIGQGSTAYIGSALLNNGTTRVEQAYVPVAASSFVQVEIAQSQTDGAFDDAFLSAIEQGIKLAEETDSHPVSPASTATVGAAGITLDIIGALAKTGTGSNGAARWYDADRKFQVYAEQYLGVLTPDPASPDRTYSPNTFAYQGGYDVSAPEWPTDYATQFATSNGGWLLGSRTIERDGFTISQFAAQCSQADGIMAYVINIVPQDSGVPTIVTMRCNIDSSRTYSPAINMMVESITRDSSTIVTQLMESQFLVGWLFKLPDTFTLEIEDFMPGLDSAEGWFNDDLSMTVLEITLIPSYGYTYSFDTTQTTIESTGNTLLNQWWQNCGNSVVMVNEWVNVSASTSSNRDWEVLVPVTDGRAASLTFSFDPRDLEFLKPLMNQIILTINISF